MKYSIQSRVDHLHAELENRETAADMRAFLLAVKQACRENGQRNVLLCVRDSRAIFKAEEYGLSGEMRGYLSDLVTPGCRVALVGDSSELHHAHDYVVLVARQQGINARAFRDVRAALEWLRSPEDRSPAPGTEASVSATAARRRP
jgi:hypothetical protein